MPARKQRVMIIGQPGSGKSTLARALGNILDLPVVHIDHITLWCYQRSPQSANQCWAF